ncbi:hypothetical protein HYALB_00007771, partial [Hymenoscyphus albidus]
RVFLALRPSKKQQILFGAATKRGATIKLGCPVVAIEENEKRITVMVKGGERVEADMVVGADGDEWLLSLDCCHVRDENSSESSEREQNIEQFRGYYKEFIPGIQKLLSYASTGQVWRLKESMPNSWVSQHGRVILIGDASHAILPWLGQGGALALEDAVTLAECLERAELFGIPKVLKAFQTIREPRCRLIQEWAAAKDKRATLPDGPEQLERDKNLKLFNPWVKARPASLVESEHLPEFETQIGWADIML